MGLDYRFWVWKIREELGISIESQMVALGILDEARERRITAGRNPKCLAAAALYIACLQNAYGNVDIPYPCRGVERQMSYRVLGVAAGVSQASVGKNCRFLIQKLNLTLGDWC
jgi:transcription initiation factor TFIIIB Brf1 subunit/transcription initiation factor TFIIB